MSMFAMCGKSGMINPWYLIPLAILALDSVKDIVRREIFPVLTFAGIVSGITYQGVIARTPALWIMASLIPGILFLFVSKVSSEQIGRGDALAVFTAGAWSSAWDIWGIVLTGTFLSGVFALFAWIIKRKNAQIPFVPFLTAGFVFCQSLIR